MTGCVQAAVDLKPLADVAFFACLAVVAYLLLR